MKFFKNVASKVKPSAKKPKVKLMRDMAFANTMPTKTLPDSRAENLVRRLSDETEESLTQSIEIFADEDIEAKFSEQSKDQQKDLAAFIHDNIDSFYIKEPATGDPNRPTTLTNKIQKEYSVVEA